jgi:hypothetical protein
MRKAKQIPLRGMTARKAKATAAARATAIKTEGAVRAKGKGRLDGACLSLSSEDTLFVEISGNGSPEFFC